MPAVIAARIHVVRLPPYVAPLGGEDEVKICPRGAARGDNDCWIDKPSIFDLIKYFGDGELSVATKQHKNALREAIKGVVSMPDLKSHQTSSTGKGGLQLVSRALAVKLFRGWGVPDAVWQPFISHCTTAHAMDVDDEPAADVVMGRPPHRIQTISRRQKRPSPATPTSSPLLLKSPDAKRLHRRSPIKGRNVPAAPVVTAAKDAGLRLLTDAGRTLEESSSVVRRPVYLDDDVVDVATRVASSTKVACHAASRALVDEPELGRGLVSMVAQAARRPELPVLLRRLVKPFGRFEPPQKLARPTADLSRWTRRRHVCARRETALDAGAVWLALQGLKPIGERGELPDLRGDAQPAFRRHDEERAVDALKDFLTENCLWPTLAVICEQTHAGRQFVAHLALRRLSTRKQGLCEAFDLWRRVGGLSQRAYDDLAARTDRVLADIAGASELRKAFEEGIVLCSTFLQGRSDKSIPSDVEGWDAAHRAELMSELAKDIPLADSAQWDRLRGEVDALVATYRDHRDFVYSSGTEGRPLKRVCDCCKRYVYLSTSDRYTLWSGEVHETCIRPKPGEAEAAVAG